VGISRTTTPRDPGSSMDAGRGMTTVGRRQAGAPGAVRAPGSPGKRAFEPAGPSCIPSTKRRLFEGPLAEAAQQPAPPQPGAAAGPAAADAARAGTGGAASQGAAPQRRSAARVLFQPAPSAEQLAHTFAAFQAEVRRAVDGLGRLPWSLKFHCVVHTGQH